jgi:hypothetical protein
MVVAKERVVMLHGYSALLGKMCSKGWGDGDIKELNATDQMPAVIKVVTLHMCTCM